MTTDGPTDEQEYQADVADDGYHPWWGDKALAAADAEKAARREDRREAEEFQRRIDAALAERREER